MSTEPNNQVLALLAKEWDMRDSPRFIRKKRFNDRSKESLFGQQPVHS